MSSLIGEGNLLVQRFNPDTGEIFQEERVHNIITDQFIDWMMNQAFANTFGAAADNDFFMGVTNQYDLQLEIVLGLGQRILGTTADSTYFPDASSKWTGRTNTKANDKLDTWGLYQPSIAIGDDQIGRYASVSRRGAGNEVDADSSQSRRNYESTDHTFTLTALAEGSSGTRIGQNEILSNGNGATSDNGNQQANNYYKEVGLYLVGQFASTPDQSAKSATTAGAWRAFTDETQASLRQTAILNSNGGAYTPTNNCFKILVAIASTEIDNSSGGTIRLNWEISFTQA